VRVKSVSDKPKNGILTGSVPLIALAIAAVLLLSLGGPTSAQFFNFWRISAAGRRRNAVTAGSVAAGLVTTLLVRFSSARPSLGGNRRRASTPVREDFSRAPPLRSATQCPNATCSCSATPWRDWLAYGLRTPTPSSPPSA